MGAATPAASNHWRQAVGRVLCCSSGSAAIAWGVSGCRKASALAKAGLYTGTMSSVNRRRARVPAQLATCSAVPAYSAASNVVSANKKGRVRVSMCTVSSGCSADNAGRRGISQRVAKVGTAASCTPPPPPWPAITSSVSCSSPCKRLATCTAYSAPRAVRATPWRVRWNSATPTKDSSAPIWRDTAPCVSASSCAARV